MIQLVKPLFRQHTKAQVLAVCIKDWIYRGKLSHAFKASRWDFFITLQQGHQMTTQYVLGRNEDGRPTLKLAPSPNLFNASPSSSNLFETDPLCSGAHQNRRKCSSPHQLTPLSISVSEPPSGAACARGQRFWKITRNSFPPWMENNKGIPHDRPLFLSSAGHKSTDLLIETPPPLFRLHHYQTLIRWFD